MKMLVGVSVFRLPELVQRCLVSLISTPADVLVIDNNADQDVKSILRVFRKKITVIINETNGYCNGAWNQIMEYGLAHEYDVIALGTGTVLYTGWYELINSRMSNVTDEVCLPKIGTPVLNPDPNNIENIGADVAGYFTFMPRSAIKLVYPIPHVLQHWFGDRYMYDKLLVNGWKIVIMNDVRAEHQWSLVTSSNPEAYAVIEQDKIAWKELCLDSGLMKE